MPRIENKKLFWSIVAIFVFLVGLVAGSFLVLKSETSEGSLFDTPNSDSSSYSSVQASNFLEDLKKFQEQQEQNPTTGSDNLTARFLAAVAQAGIDQNLTPEDYSNPEFLYATVLPQLAELNVNLFPEVPDSDIRVSVKITEEEYLSKIKNTYLLLIAGAWQKVLTANPQIDPEQRKEFLAVSVLLALTKDELKNHDVPPKYREVHRGLIQLAGAVEKVIDDGIFDKERDPIKALVTINKLDEVAEFAQKLLAEIDRLEKSL